MAIWHPERRPSAVQCKSLALFHTILPPPPLPTWPTLQQPTYDSRGSAAYVRQPPHKVLLACEGKAAPQGHIKESCGHKREHLAYRIEYLNPESA